MERSRSSGLKMVVLLVTLFWVSGTRAQSAEDWSCRLQQLYAEGSQEKWPLVMREMSLKKQTDHRLRLVLSSARYGYIGMLLGQKRKQEAKAEVELLERELEALQKILPTNTQVMSMRAGLVGYRIGISPLRAPFLGPEFGRLIDAASALDPDCPYVLTEQANSLFFRPSMFGGDKIEALKQWQKASGLFAKQGQACNWYALHVRVMMVKGYETLGDEAAAKQQKAALAKEFPMMGWVK